jgi:glycosyltransferase involved in cell wall biosynthesis
MVTESVDRHMDLSVVIPTLNGRDRLAAGLDALAAHAPNAEVVVVNGPSTDGTTGMVRDRDDVDVLVEVATRTTNVARNAGIETASGEVVALLRQDRIVEAGWLDGLTDGLGSAPVVTGPTHRPVDGGVTTEESERGRIGNREVTHFNGGNVAFRREVLCDLDGFDEYLETGGARDAAHRLAGLGHRVAWRNTMAVRRGYSADGGVAAVDRKTTYRSLAYRLVKNYGARPGVASGAIRRALGDCAGAAADVVRGDLDPTEWLAAGRGIVTGLTVGAVDGVVARATDRTPARNPHGLSDRSDRAVTRYDRR